MTEADSNDITDHPHDDKPRPYLCTVCGKRFAQKAYLIFHGKLHTSVNAYSCTECEKRFSTQRYLNRHMNAHSSRFKCTECGKCFRDKEKLSKHSQVHPGEKPFECTNCCKQFVTSSDLFLHSRIHSGEKPYKCHVCDKAFCYSFNLQTHMRVHTGEKPYKCSLCGKSYTQSGNLKLHKRHAHSNRRPCDWLYSGKLLQTSNELKLHFLFTLKRDKWTLFKTFYIKTLTEVTSAQVIERRYLLARTCNTCQNKPESHW